MKKIIILFFIHFSLIAFCQEREATILFNDSTSIKGFAEIKKEKIFFRVSLNDEVTEWDYDKAIGIIFSGYGFSEKYLYIKPGKYSKKPVIMEVIEESNVCLYKKSVLAKKLIKFPQRNEPISPSNPYYKFPKAERVYDIESTYYVKKTNEEYATDISFSFRDNSMRYFSDCIELVEKIKTKEFKKEDILEIVDYYNDYCGKDNED